MICNSNEEELTRNSARRFARRQIGSQDCSIFLQAKPTSDGVMKGKGFFGGAYIYPKEHPRVLEEPVIFKSAEAEGGWIMKRIFKDVRGDKFSNEDYEDGFVYNRPIDVGTLIRGGW